MAGPVQDLFGKVEPPLLAALFSGLALMTIAALVRNYILGKQLESRVDAIEKAREDDHEIRSEDQKRIGALEREVPQVSLIVETLTKGFDQLRDEWHTGFTAVIERVQGQGEDISYIRGMLSAKPAGDAS